MKHSVITWLAIVLLTAQGTGARAQQGPQSKPQNAQHQQGNQPDQQSVQNEDALRAAIAQQAALLDLSYVNNQVEQRNINWLQDLGVWLDASNQNDLSLSPADDALRAHLGLPKDQGLIVTALAANTSAARAGIQQNDVLLKLGDAPLAKPDDLEEGLKGAGDKPAALTVLRGGKKIVVQVQPRVRVTMGPVQPEPPTFWIGISVSDLEPALRSQLNLPANQGLLAIEVHKDSPAAKAEVKLHDILVSLADHQLDSQQKLIELVQASGDKSVPLQLIRQGKTMTIEVTPRRRKQAQAFQKVNTYVVSPTLSYQLVRPGAVFTNSQIVGEQPGTIALQAQGAGETAQGQEAMAKVSRRLEDFDAEIKQLRKAIDELSKVLKDKK